MNDVTTILVVEDEPAHVELLKRAVGDTFPAASTTTLDGARKRLARPPLPSLVLADLNLRDGKGYELLPGPLTPASFPLLVLTSHGDEATAAFAIKAGALEYIVKSAENLGELPRIIERALRDWQLVVERRAAEEALRDSEERFRVLFSASPDAYLLHDEAGVIRDGNRAAERIFGMPIASIRGRSGTELGLPPRDDASNDAQRPTGDDDQSTGPDLVRLRRAGGSELMLEVRTARFHVREGIMLLTIARDVTRQKETEDARRRLEEQLHQALKLEAMGRLAGGVAHDFNNILTGVLGFTELIAEQLSASSPIQDDVAEIRACAEKAASLTGQLLAFSRKQIIEPRTFDANEVTLRGSRLLRRLIGEHIALEVTTADEPTIVTMDPHQFEQVLVNLAVNARDAMPGGGRMTISVGHETLRESDCELRVDARPGRYVVVDVSDTGTGMTKEVLAHVFEPFFTTKAEKGTGLGLPTSYGIVRQAGGFIEVSSEPRVGTKFRVFLPAVTARGAESEGARPLEQKTGGREHLLLVEDDDTLRALVSRYLRQRGYTVVSERHAGDALLVAEDASVRIDLLVSDVILPTINGPTLYQRLRKLRPTLRVLFVSGYSDSEALQSAHAAGELLAKPFSLDALATKIRALLDEVPREAG